MNSIDAIVLAAGASARFGTDKRLYVVDGMPMLQRALVSIIDAVRTVYVVLQEADRDQLPVLLGSFVDDQRISPLLLAQPECGMGSNLARAVAQLPGDSSAVLVMLADLPFLQPVTARMVVAARQPARIIVPVCCDEDGSEHVGHPVLFAREFFAGLEKLEGDTGARSLLQHHAGAVIHLPVPDAGICRDIDRLPDWSR